MNRKPVSEITKKRISKSLKGIVRPKGKSNPNWKNGLGMTGRNNFVKSKVKIRDDYTCQVCGLREPEIMEIDHIKPKGRFPELKYVMENMITLCPNCHKRKTVRDRKMYKLGNYK